MPDRTFGEPADDGDEWLHRRDHLVAELQAAPHTSRALRGFANALADLDDAVELQTAFSWIEHQGRSTDG